MPPVPTFVITHLAALWAGLLGCIGLGFLVRRFACGSGRLPGIFAPLFADLVCGILVLSLVWAAYTTRFRTVLLLLIPVGLALAWLARRGARSSATSAVSPSSGRVRAILEMLVVASLFYALQAILHVDSRGGPLGIHIPHPDIVYFSKIGDASAKTGFESIYDYNALLSPAYDGATPYHFLEIWLGVALGHLVGTPTIVALSLLVPALLAAAIALGLWTLAEGDTPPSAVLRSLLVMWLFVPSPAVQTYRGMYLLAEANEFAYPVLQIDGIKVAAIYLMLLTALILARRRLHSEALVLIVALLPVSTIALPGAVGAVAIVLILDLALKGRLLPSRRWVVLLTLGLTLAGFFTFYAAFGNTTTRLTSLSAMAVENTLAGAWRTRANIIVKSLIQVFVIYFFHLVLAAVCLWRLRRRGATLAPCLIPAAFVLSGILGYALVFKEPLSVELATIPAATGIYAILLLVVIEHEALRPSSRMLQLTLFAAGSILIWQAFGAAWAANREASAGHVSYRHRYSLDYLKEIAAAAPWSPLGGYCVVAEDVASRWDVGKAIPAPVPQAYALGAYLPFFPQYYSATLLAPSLPGTERFPNALHQETVFRRYYEDLRRTEGPIELPEAQARFLDRLGFVIATAGAEVPNAVVHRASRTIRDENTGERVFILRRPPQATP